MDRSRTSSRTSYLTSDTEVIKSSMTALLVSLIVVLACPDELLAVRRKDSWVSYTLPSS